MSRTYVIPDLHGRFDLLESAVDRIMTDPEPGTIVTLGDYVDRGPQSRQVIQLLIRGIPHPWKLITLKGNHEDMMQQVCGGRADIDWCLGNGGAATLVSYGQKSATAPIRMSFLLRTLLGSRAYQACT